MAAEISWLLLNIPDFLYFRFRTYRVPHKKRMLSLYIVELRFPRSPLEASLRIGDLGLNSFGAL
jgi:hypothetical protein